MDPRNFTYMFYGFSVAWLMIVILALSMVGRERKLRDEIARLKSMLEEKERK
jgi:hypothetical protein